MIGGAEGIEPLTYYAWFASGLVTSLSRHGQRLQVNAVGSPLVGSVFYVASHSALPKTPEKFPPRGAERKDYRQAAAGAGARAEATPLRPPDASQQVWVLVSRTKSIDRF